MKFMAQNVIVMKMKNKVRITLEYNEDRAFISIRLNNELIADGVIGGEPEDNNFYRTYSWIIPSIKLLAEKLYAEVEIEEVEAKEY